MNKETIADLVAAGRTILPIEFQALFYALKDAILTAYAIPDGLDCQKWYDEDWYNEGDTWAEHVHLLERHILWGHVFHRPTGEYSYFNFRWQFGKGSDRFDELVPTVKETFEGKKKKRYDATSRSEGWSAFKRLVKAHGHLLRQAQAQLPLPDVGSLSDSAGISRVLSEIANG